MLFQVSRFRGSDFIGAHVPELSRHTSLHLKYISSYIYRVICFKFGSWIGVLDGVELELVCNFCISCSIPEISWDKVEYAEKSRML